MADELKNLKSIREGLNRIIKDGLKPKTDIYGDRVLEVDPDNVEPNNAVMALNDTVRTLIALNKHIKEVEADEKQSVKLPGLKARA